MNHAKTMTLQVLVGRNSMNSREIISAIFGNHGVTIIFRKSWSISPMARPSWSTSTKIWLSPASPTTRRTAPKNCVLEFRNEKSPRPWGAHGTIAPLFGNAKAVGAPTGTGSWRFVCWMGGEQLDLHLDHVESLQKMCHPDPNPPKEENGRSLLGPGQPLKSPETFRICCDSMKDASSLRSAVLYGWRTR